MFHYKIQVVNRTEFTVKSAERVRSRAKQSGIFSVSAPSATKASLYRIGTNKNGTDIDI